jgi:signal peptidase I
MDENNPFFEQKTDKRNIFIRFIEITAGVLTVLVLAYLIIINPNEVDGPSMLPNFQTNQLLFVNKLYATSFGNSIGLNYQRGDVVVFKFPQAQNREVVKRVIGLPGETIRLEEGVFYINGQAFIENFDIIPDTINTHDFLNDGGASRIIPENEYFLVGDNRQESADSRKFGPVNKDLIVGKVILRVGPLSAFGFIGTGEFELE